MRLNKLKLFLYLGNFILFTLLSSSIGAVTVTKIDNKYPLTDFSKPLVVRPQMPSITINLPANPSTGYQWYLLQYDDRILEPSGYQYIPAKNKLAGAPGISSWQFQLKKSAFQVPRVSHIEFEYRRMWETANGNRQSITVITSPGA